MNAPKTPNANLGVVRTESSTDSLRLVATLVERLRDVPLGPEATPVANALRSAADHIDGLAGILDTLHAALAAAQARGGGAS